MKDIQRQCYERLVKSEMNICAFNLRHGNTKGAEQRLAYINEHLRKQVPTLETELLALETNLNTQLGKPAPAIENSGLLNDSFILAENTTQESATRKRSMVDRF